MRRDLVIYQRHRNTGNKPVQLITRLVPFLIIACLPIAFGITEKHCDDRKCGSVGYDLAPWRIGSCWAEENNPETVFVPSCSDGFEVHKFNISLGTFSYYTCCPPADAQSELDEAAASIFIPPPKCTYQACTSEDGEGGTDCWADAPAEPMSCDQSSVYKYPRKTGLFSMHSGFWYSYYACCDSSEGGSPPLQHDLVVAEGISIGLCCFALIFMLSLIIGILASKKARGRTYNLYLVALAVPDVIYNGMILAVGARAVAAKVNSCSVYNGVSHFYMAANLYLNAIVAHQVYKLLCNSKARRRTNPPTKCAVIKQLLAVFLLSVCVAVWAAVSLCSGMFNIISLNPDHVLEGRLVVSLNIAVIAFPPFAYMTYICFRVWKYKLLPRTGRTRVLSLYFMRVIVVFALFWIPIIFLSCFERGGHNGNRAAMHYAYRYLASLQGIMSTAVAMMKPDVRNAMLTFFMCRCGNEDKIENNESPEESGVHSRRNWWKSSSFGHSVRNVSSLLRKMSSMRNSVLTKSTMNVQNKDREDVETKGNSHPEGINGSGHSKVRKKRGRGSTRLSWNMSSVDEGDAADAAEAADTWEDNDEETDKQSTVNMEDEEKAAVGGESVQLNDSWDDEETDKPSPVRIDNEGEAVQAVQSNDSWDNNNDEEADKTSPVLIAHQTNAGDDPGSQQRGLERVCWNLSSLGLGQDSDRYLNS